MRCQNNKNNDKICYGPIRPKNLVFGGEKPPEKFNEACLRIRNRKTLKKNGIERPYLDGGMHLLIVLGSNLADSYFND
jgi:hypothetical protein